MTIVAKLVLFILLPLFILVPSSFANHIPAPSGFVNDFAGVLSSQQKAQLETQLSDYEKKTGNEISVTIVKNLNDSDIEDFTVKTFEEWKIGKKNKDNGILILAAIEDRQVRIEVGYGLEGFLTDGEAGDIIRQDIVPAFAKGDYNGGISSAINSVKAQLDGSASAPSPDNSSKKVDSIYSLIVFIFFVFVYLFSFLARSKSFWAGGVAGGIIGAIGGFLIGGIVAVIVGVPVLAGLGLLLDFILSKNYKIRKAQGKSTGFWGSGGGFSGGSGRGFGGFGGGMSGGGGASGRW